jgi:hypothetical protein
MPTNQPLRPAQILRLVGLAEIVLGLVLLIAGFAADVLVLAIVGGVLVPELATSTLFVFSRTLARGQGPAAGSARGDQPPRWPPE